MPSSSSVLDNDHLLTVILRHLPPRPSSLPHASLVCRRWRDLAASRSFLRGFRAFHRAAAPVLGVFHNAYLGGPDRRFVAAAADPPDRVPASLFCLPFGRDHRSWRFLDCRHGRALLLGPVAVGSPPRREVLVWDPMTGERRRMPLPPDAGGDVRHGAVLCACGRERDCRSSHFQVVLVWFKLGSATELRRAVAAVYSSESGSWGPIITVKTPFMSTAGDAAKPGTLAGEAVYWLIPESRILEFDAAARKLAVISVPACAAGSLYWQRQLVLTEAKELGLAMVTEASINMWKRDSANACGWSVYRSVQLDGCLPPRKSMQGQPSLLGFHEESNAIFVWIKAGVFMIQLETMQSRLLCQGVSNFEIYPFAGFYFNTRDATAGAQGDDIVDTHGLAMDTLNMWHYEDPQGDLHGPCPMVMLWRWSNSGFFTGDFKVWRTDETKEQAILLTDAMRPCGRQFSS
ncbi:unnamed protein product [Urochloa humidicola]